MFGTYAIYNMFADNFFAKLICQDDGRCGQPLILFVERLICGTARPAGFAALILAPAIGGWRVRAPARICVAAALDRQGYLKLYTQIGRVALAQVVKDAKRQSYNGYDNLPAKI